jgi:hypothetical protein
MPILESLYIRIIDWRGWFTIANIDKIKYMRVVDPVQFPTPSLLYMLLLNPHMCCCFSKQCSNYIPTFFWIMDKHQVHCNAPLIYKVWMITIQCTITLYTYGLSVTCSCLYRTKQLHRITHVHVSLYVFTRTTQIFCFGLITYLTI